MIYFDIIAGIGMKETIDRVNRRISRRSFIKGLLGAGMVAETGIAVKSLFPPNTIDEDSVEELSEYSSRIADRIRIEKFDEPFVIDGKLIKITPNKEAMSQLITQLAYVDGGLDEVKSVTNFIQERGLIINITEDVTVKGEFFASNNKKESPVVSLNRKKIEEYYIYQSDPDEEVYKHEFQHLIQQGRNPELYEKWMTVRTIGVPLVFLATGITIGKYFYDESIKKEKKINIGRRCFLLSGSLVLGSVLGYNISNLLIGYTLPEEQEAYLRNLVLPNRLVLENTQGKLFSFEGVKND